MLSAPSFTNVSWDAMDRPVAELDMRVKIPRRTTVTSRMLSSNTLDDLGLRDSAFNDPVNQKKQDSSHDGHDEAG